MADDLGDRMKRYEDMECDRRLMHKLPVMARIDGRAFHTFTRGMDRPYDDLMTRLMIDTTKYLVQETNACMGYTQSDEITLAWHVLDPKAQIWFDGRITKMVSQLAAQATLWFNRRLAELAPEYLDRLPTFDARVWNVPDRTEAANVFVWREWDATRNSLSMAASCCYSANELHGKNGSQQQEMLFQKGVNWDDYPVAFKRGVYIQRRKVFKPFSAEEIDRLPAKHTARSNPDLVVERSEYRQIEMPVITTVLNRESVIFDGCDPVVAPKAGDA
jgi:tRNA(His) guanylyltransferase